MKELWSLDKIKKLEVPTPIGISTVEEFLPQVLEEIREDVSTQYAILKKSMKENGQLVPIRINRAHTRLRDGIHRIATATELGWNLMEVSSDIYVNPWDETEEGKKYWRLWNWRLDAFRVYPPS